MYRGRMYCRSGGLHSGFSSGSENGSSSALFVPICFWRSVDTDSIEEMGLVFIGMMLWCGPSEQEEFSAYISEAPRKEFGRVSQTTHPYLFEGFARIPPRRPSMIGRIPILGMVCHRSDGFSVLIRKFSDEGESRNLRPRSSCRSVSDQVVCGISFSAGSSIQVVLFAGVVPQVVELEHRACRREIEAARKRIGALRSCACVSTRRTSPKAGRNRLAPPQTGRRLVDEFVPFADDAAHLVED